MSKFKASPGNYSQSFTFYDKIQFAINILKFMEPPAWAWPDGYHLAFSGGKDSIVIHDLAVRSGVRFKAYFYLTGLEIPELIKFTKHNYPEITFLKPDMTYQEICLKKHIMPTRIMRFCCEALKEIHGDGGIITGVKREESVKRRNLDFVGFHHKKARAIFISPIVDWTASDVWRYIAENNLPYPKIYKTQSRTGCIMCPISGKKGMIRDERLYPAHALKFKKICNMLYNSAPERYKVTSGDELYHWWIYAQK